MPRPCSHSWEVFRATPNNPRVWRLCRRCRRKEYRDGGKWRYEFTLQAFAEKWLPAVSGTDFKDMMTVKVAFPFEYQSYESWKPAIRVRFHFTDVVSLRAQGLGTLTDVMNGWQSKYHPDLNAVDYEAEQFYEKVTGKPYQIGDNTYAEMRAIIQS